MPPKKRGGPPSAPTPKKPRTRQSKLAKENDISAEQETEIKEAFHLFSSANEAFPDEKEGVISRSDIRKALVALNLPPSDSSELQTILSATDPTNTGYVPYGPFVAVAAAKLHSRDEIDEDAVAAEVDAAYRLFTRGSDGPITLNHLKRIARELKEDSVGEELLRDMILEANGGGVGEGVTREQFRDVMDRAGVF
ncbi:hypothetical protein SI65_08901 [Aspergillus cristatus]|uniref:EF-hand superfamily Ca2+-modulated protein n=1 Tax=Aspergillus cristatus TaxID=573508 RepID=A0A1E3B3Z1_ASPCR|nr:hypothetical protein SI65_08901 [Aspergillus cristatus]